MSSEPSRSKATSQTGSSGSTSSYLNTTGSASGLSSSTAATAAGPSLHSPGSVLASAGGSPSGAESVGAASGGPTSDESTCSVQFMWQPLSDIRYPSITLLASFKVSSVVCSVALYLAGPLPLFRMLYAVLVHGWPSCLHIRS